MASSRRKRRASRVKARARRRKQDHNRAEERAIPKEEEYTGLLKFLQVQYKPLLFVPFILLFGALLVLGISYVQTGEVINKGVSLKGGSTITINSAIEDPAYFEQALRTAFPQADINVRTIAEFGRPVGLIVDTSDVADDEIVQHLVNNAGIDKLSIAVESIGPSLGESFFRQTILAMIFSFIFMGIVVFLYFRTLVPSMAVILAALSDILVTLAVVTLMDIRLSTAGIAAFLMLIGYSVDTDILLSTKVLKRRQGSVFTRTVNAMKTGLTMSVTTLAAIVVSLMVSRSEVITQIMTILLIGLLVDIINTWLQNAGLLRWYLERKGESG